MNVNLTDAEWKIIAKLWENEPMTIMQLTASFKDETDWSKSTVITLLKRMTDKKAIYYVQDGRTKRYYSLVKKTAAAAAETKTFLDKIYNGSIGMMISAMVEEEQLSKEDIAELYAILKKAGDKND